MNTVLIGLLSLMTTIMIGCSSDNTGSQAIQTKTNDLQEPSPTPKKSKNEQYENLFLEILQKNYPSQVGQSSIDGINHSLHCDVFVTRYAQGIYGARFVINITGTISGNYNSRRYIFQDSEVTNDRLTWSLDDGSKAVLKFNPKTYAVDYIRNSDGFCQLPSSN
jgi:hypothetical protein